MKKRVAIFQIRDILFSVMRDMITCEEVFGLNADAVAAHGEDAWVAGVTVANGFDGVEDEAAVSYTHLPSPRDATLSRMPSSA